MIIFVIVNIILYAILFGISWKRKYIAISGPHVDWIFQFGPQFLAVFINLFVVRMATDYGSIEPYIKMACPWMAHPSSPSYRVERKSLCLYEQDWYHVSIGRLSLATYFASMIFIPFQAAVMKQRTTVIQTSSEPFISTTGQGFVSVFNGSMLPQLAIEALWESQTTVPILQESHYQDFVAATAGTFPGNDPPNPYDTSPLFNANDIVSSPFEITPTLGSLWTSILDLNDWDYSYDQPQSLAVLPFWPENAISQQGQVVSWTSQASGVYSDLRCTQVENITVFESVSAPFVSPNGENETNITVSITLTDSYGCKYDISWFDSGNINIWDFLYSADTSLLGYANTSANAECWPAHYILTGTVPEMNTTTGYVPVETGNSSGWAALSCRAHYFEVNGTFTVDLNENNTTLSNDGLSHTHAKALDPNGTSLDYWMAQNHLSDFLVSGAIINLPDLVTGRTMWDNNLADNYDNVGSGWETLWQIEQTGYGVNGADRNASLPDPRDWGCEGVVAGPGPWTNPIACQMLKHAVPMWSTLFLYSAAAVSRVVSASEENMVHQIGHVETEANTWYLSAFSFAESMLFHLTLIGILWSHTWLSDESRKRNSQGGAFPKRAPKTGIVASPGSIAGKALLFRDLPVRDMYRGLDAIDRDLATKEYRSREEEWDFVIVPDYGGKSYQASYC